MRECVLSVIGFLGLGTGVNVSERVYARVNVICWYFFYNISALNV